MNFLDNVVTFFGFQPMICYECFRNDGEMYKTKCLETRTYHDEKLNYFWVKRTHQCTNCDEKFCTIENITEAD